MAVLLRTEAAQETLAASAAVTTVKGRSLWQDAMRRFVRNKAAMAGVFTILLIAVMSVLGPLVSPHGIEDVYWDQIGIPPTFANSHWFGTDSNGRDLFVRTMFGAQISLSIGLVTTLVALAIGVTYGAVAGFFGGVIDNVMMRIVDVLYALPLLFFIILLVVLFGRNIFLVFMAIGAVEWLTMARIVRGQTLAVKQKEYVEAARATGVSTPAILWRYVIPNSIGPVIVFVTLLVPAVILVESFLSFLGLGVQEPLTSWGVLISQGAGALETAPWQLFIPAGFLAATMFAFNFIGDGLRDALDPKDR
jgi:oligopeptide transport system permease protein